MLLRAVRDQEPRMVASGHPTSRYLHLAHCAASGLAGIGGALLVTVQQTVTPGDVGFDTASLALLACVLGGGRLLGAVAGVAVILTVRDVIASPFAGHGPLLVGTLYLAAAYLLHSRPGRQLTARVTATIGRLRPRPAAGHPLPARAGETPDLPDTAEAAPDAVAAGGPR
jgi:branched-chain amino acid transport system permease protein